MPPSGRPAKQRGVLPLDTDSLTSPARILIDTTIVVDAFLESQDRHLQARALLSRLADHESTVVFSRLLELELAQAVSNIAAAESGRSRNAAQADGRIRRRALTLTERTFARWTAYLESVAWVRGELPSIIDSVPSVMRTTGLRSNDAAMTATAIAFRCDAIASTDRHFGRVHQQDIPMIFTPRDRVADVRRFRAAARRI